MAEFLAARRKDKEGGGVVEEDKVKSAEMTGNHKIYKRVARSALETNIVVGGINPYVFESMNPFSIWRNQSAGVYVCVFVWACVDG